MNLIRSIAVLQSRDLQPKISILVAWQTGIQCRTYDKDVMLTKYHQSRLHKNSY